MENTLNLLLQDSQAKWFILGGAKAQGPLSGKEIAMRVQSGNLGFGSHVWKQGWSNWQRLYDVEDFKCLLPAEPPASVLQELLQSLKPAPTPPPVKQREEPRSWYVHQDESQYGPFTIGELKSMLECQRIGAQTYVWKQGMAEWHVMSAMPEFKDMIVNSPTLTAENKKDQRADKRKAPRKPFAAKVILTDGKEIGWALCRDISVGGMQVLMDQSPGGVGTNLKINVNAAGDVPSFACEGVIVRLLEDGRGFSYRFMGLPDSAKAAIEKYIQSV